MRGQFKSHGLHPIGRWHGLGSAQQPSPGPAAVARLAADAMQAALLAALRGGPGNGELVAGIVGAICDAAVPWLGSLAGAGGGGGWL